MIMLMKSLSFIILLSALSAAEAQTINAASCSSTDVQAAINAASVGGTVNIPAGNCSWSSLAVNKAVTLQGAGQATAGTTCPLNGTSNIAVSGSHTIAITKQAAGTIRIQGLNFTAQNGGATQPFLIQGGWQGTQPVIFQNDSFCGNNNNMGAIFVPGGVIFSHIYSVGTWDNGAVWEVKDGSNIYNSWRVADSIGANDTNGLLNIYFEDSTFYGSTNAFVDCDDGCRIVVRHNTFIYSSFNSHGYDTSPYGMRHFEVYNNSFTYPGPANGQDGQPLANSNWLVWIRGGTGVIYNNAMTNNSAKGWGTKPQVKLNCRACAEGVNYPTASYYNCSNLTYPLSGNAAQLGQNWRSGGFFTDPIYIWGNTGGPWGLPESDDFGWTNACGLPWSNFFQWGRDAVNPAVSGGSAKTGYTPYTYPHPLATGSGSARPTPPIGLNVVVN